MSIHKLSSRPRLARFAAIGALVSLLFAAVGHRLDTAVPAISLDRQILYNWLTLLFSPASFLLRLRAPDVAIVPGLSFVVIAAAFNTAWYALLSWSYSALRQSFSHHVTASTSASAGILSSAALSGGPSASRRSSPAERLAERYEHRLSSEHTDSSDREVSVLSGTER